MRAWVVGWIALTGCADLVNRDVDTDPPPPPVTARFVADAYIQDCEFRGDEWLGVRALRLTLHHRLEEVAPIALPEPGTCTAGLELFDEERLPGGDPLPEFDGRPAYDSPEASGSLPNLVPGLWHGDAFVSPERCGTLSESVGDGATLTDAGALTDLGSPAASNLGLAYIDGIKFVDHGPISRGDSATFTWEADGWNAAFVQIRRVHEGELRQTITCGVEGTSFTLDNSAWSLADEGLLAEGNQIYLGLVNQELVETADGSARAWMISRALHVLEAE